MISNQSQGTEAWMQERLGHVTASMFGMLLKQPHAKAAKEAGELTDGQLSYLRMLAGEAIAGQPETPDDYDTFAMRRGKELEPEARAAYIWSTGNAVTDVGFVKHPTESLVGGSPDGLIGTDGIIEIKCRLTYKNHVAMLIDSEFPEDDRPQCQGNLWITGRKFCDYCSYDPRFPENKRLSIYRLARDEAYIAMLSAKVLSFRNKLAEAIQKLRS